MKNIKMHGSYTVEAAFLFPVVVLLCAFLLNTAISLYQCVDREAGDTKQLQEMDSVELFYKSAQAEEIRDILDVK